MLRAGLFERVSTEEQSRHGFSIETQRQALEEYCAANHIKIVDHYTDAGVSGGKPWKQRPELRRLISDVEAGKIDVILFTKLDRWFRNVVEYYKVQEILDKHGVTWRAIWEDYNTSTANGKFAVNIFLAVAENERLRTSERVKAIFENKTKNKECCFGARFAPLGYTVITDADGKKRLVKDPETMEAVQCLWDTLKNTGVYYRAIATVREKYGIVRSRTAWHKIRQNTLYCGIYKGVEGFCEPYIDKKDFDRVQPDSNKKRTPTGTIYQFTRILHCPVCGGLMGGAHQKRSDGSKYKYYHCKKKLYNCTFHGVVTENRIENELLAHLNEYLSDTILRAEITAKERENAPKGDINKLRERLRKLNVIYMAGNITDGEYLEEQTAINAAIKDLETIEPEPVQNLEPLKELLNTDFESIYKTLTEQERQEFWHRLIDRIDLDENKHVSKVVFKT